MVGDGIKKMSPKTDLQRLNELIDWYEKNKPEAGQRILVSKTPRELHKMLGVPPSRDKRGDEVFPAELPYRNRVIVAREPRRDV
jgi:hypothetical protein